MSDDINKEADASKQLLEPNELSADAKIRLDYLERNYKEAFKERDKIKAKKIDEVEKSVLDRMEDYRSKFEEIALENKSLKEDAKYKDLYSKEVGTAKERAEKAESKLNEYIKAQKDSLLERLPEGEAREIASKLDLEELRKFTSLLTKNVVKTDKNLNVNPTTGIPKFKNMQEYTKWLQNH